MQTEEVKKYYDILNSKKRYLIAKRIFDFTLSLVMSLVFLPFIVLVGIMIKIDSPGKIFFLQKRVTTNGKVFKIFKFRTMKENSEKLSGVTVDNDPRITKLGKYLRKFRIDEIPQIFNILTGDLSFVGARPESVKYVKEYSPEMYATLLMPAGVTSPASILFKDEAELLKGAQDPDETYVKDILPKKMAYNLEYIENLLLKNELDFALIETTPLHQLKKIAFYQDELVIIVHPKHPLLKVKDLKELEYYDYYSREKGSSIYELVHSYFISHDLDIVPTIECTNPHALIELVKQNDGFTILPYSLVKESKEITYLKNNDFQIQRSYHIVMHKDKKLLPLYQEIFELIKKE